MHSRKKKNFDTRISAVKTSILYTEGTEFYKKPENERYNILDFSEIFGNDNPVYLEIGCGKGSFICKMAAQNPDINFVAVERISNVLLSACEAAAPLNLTNLQFINCSADNLEYLMEKASISRIYLNFSCPHPKNTYANRRLTHPRFLDIYKYIMRPNAEIFLKTDNQKLYEFSLETLSSAGFTLKNITLDLHNSVFCEDNIMTEYESKFVARGDKIYRLEAFLK